MVSNADSSNTQRQIGVNLCSKEGSIITAVIKSGENTLVDIKKEKDQITTNKNYSVTMVYSITGNHRGKHNETKGCIYVIKLVEV